MTHNLKILILEDVPTDADLVEHELKKGGIIYTARRVENEEEYSRQLLEFKPDIILSDYMLPQFTGMEALLIARKQSPDTPFIIVTGSMNEEVAVESIKAGAWDYVTKEHLIRLVPSVKGVLERKSILEAKRSAEVETLMGKSDWVNTFNAIPDMITIHDTEFNILRANKAAMQVMDLKEFASSTLQKCFKVFHKTDGPIDECPGRKCMESKEPSIVEIYDPLLDRQIEIRAIPLMDSSREVLKIIHLIRDVTERKQAKIKEQNLVSDLKKSKHEWESTFDSASEMIALVDKRFTIMRCNKSFSEYAKKSLKDIAGTKYCEYFPCEYDPSGKNTPGQDLPNIEININGNRWFNINSYDVLDDDGNYMHSVMIGAEITKLKDTQNSLQKSFDDMEDLFLNLVNALVNALDAKSPWTNGHSKRVAGYAKQIALEMGFDYKVADQIHLAGLLHDIGKIGTYDYLLDKPSRLTNEEYELVKKHPLQGVTILEGIKQLINILPIIKYHHERVDGKGYPDGLKGEEIPLEAKILHVADSFDSMTSDRPYRPSPGIEHALSEFANFSNIQFDSQVVDAFINILGRERKVGIS